MRIFIGLLLFFVNVTLVFAGSHIISIEGEKKISSEAQMVDADDTVVWRITADNARFYDTDVATAAMLRITFISNNPTIGTSVITDVIDPQDGAEIMVTLKGNDDLNDGSYPYTIEILDDSDNVLTTFADPMLFAFSIGLGGSSHVSGNCQSVTTTVTGSEGCFAVGNCKQDIGLFWASISLTNLIVRNESGSPCEVRIEGLTHPFSARGGIGKTKLSGRFASLDANQDMVVLTGKPIGSGPDLTAGPLFSSPPPFVDQFFFQDTGWIRLTSKNTTTRLKLILNVSLGSAIGERAYFANSGEYSVKNEPGLVELSFFDVLVGEQGNYISWESSVENDNAGFRIWRAVDNGNGKYTDISVLRKLHSKFSNDELSDNKLVAVSVEDSSSDEFIAVKDYESLYTYVDTSVLVENVTYYYLLEDVDMYGVRTFHCDHLSAITIGQGPEIDLVNAQDYCEDVTTH